MAFAVGSSAAALILFTSDPLATYAWTCYLASLLLFLAALDMLFGGPEGDTRRFAFSRWIVLPGLVILGLALFMRLYRFETVPFGTWWDEADIGLKALQLLQVPGSGLATIDYHPNALHYPYFVSLAFRLLGVGTLSIRALSVLFGLGTVVVAFLAGREAHGTRFGLLLAFFATIARWSVTFSRLGMSTITAPFFALLAIFLLLRARRTQSLPDFAAAGLVVGLGLGLHASFRLFPFVVLVFLVWWSVAQWLRKPLTQEQKEAWVTSLVIFVLGLGLAAAPVAQYILRDPDGFTARTAKVSIFSTREEPNLAMAIGSNTAKHLLMFNYQGDRNGRHNLPGAPLLDPITGTLFVLGFGLALSRLRDPTNLLFVVLFFTGLAGAILTLDFEAPQAQRAILAMPAVLYFAALATEAWWRGLDRSRLGPLAYRAALAALFLVAGLAFYLNAHTYFVRQATNAAVWEAHNAAETLAARQLRELDLDNTTIYLSEQLQGERVVEFLAPKARDSRKLLPAEALPLREPGDRAVAILVEQDQARLVDMILRYYPQAERIEYLNPDGDPELYTLIIPATEIQKLQGLEARYWAGHTPEGDPIVTRTESVVDADWPGAAPLSAPFTAGWDTILYVPEFGEYEFALQSPGAATVWLDLLPLLSSEEPGEHRAGRTLAQGKHRLRLRASSGPGALRLSWRKGQDAPFETVPAWALYRPSLVDTNGLLATYYADADHEAPPALVRIEPQIDRYIHHIPFQRPYAVDWTGAIEIPASGDYTFQIWYRGQARLFIDNQLVADAPGPEGRAEGSRHLEAGRHALRLEFLDHLNNSRIHLYWSPPGEELKVVPSDVLFPFAHAPAP
jgi:4-amino-4-deoxy-L-arabinose transferase-like glycosyltransferase